jgi:biopolymer transport protein ExbD
MAGGEGAAVERGKKGGLKRRAKFVNDLTPMVDIGFLLVIFFMTTTVFREPQAIEISLPPKGTVLTAQSNVITLAIDSLGQVTKQLSDEKPSPIIFDSIESYLRAEERKNIEKQPGGLDFLAQAQALQARHSLDSLDKINRFISRQVSKLVVLIDVHPKSLYQNMVQVMDQVQAAGMTRFSIIPHEEKKTATTQGG